MSELPSTFPLLRVVDGNLAEATEGFWDEIGCAPRALPTRLQDLGTRLDDTTFAEVVGGVATLRVRLNVDFDERPVRLRRVAADSGGTVLEVRSLAHQFRLESLLRRSGLGHMLISPDVDLQWSMTSNDLNAVLPGDDPMGWVELMDPDDMQTLGKAIAAVGADPNLRKTVSHRLNADRTYTIIDHVESALHDPDLRAVLVRSHLEDQRGLADTGNNASHAGIAVSDHMPIGVVVASLTGTVLHRNAVAAELLGARVGQRVVSNGDESWLLERMNPEQTARFQAVFASAAAGQSAHCTVNSPFDLLRWLRISISPAAASTVVLTIEDATELAEAERALRASNRLFEALDAQSEDLVIVFDAAGRARYVNPRTLNQLADGVSIEHIDDVIGLVNDSDRATVEQLVRETITNPSSSAEVEVRIDRGPDRLARWHHATLTNLIDDPDVQGIVLTVRDVHERHLVERELHFRATHDALTTLPDRAALHTRLETLLLGAAVNHRTALMFCDLDNFKQINDSAGHHVGDQVLTEVADRLRAALRVSDFVGRFGGDEFVVVAPAVTDEAHAMEVAKRMFNSVTGAANIDGHDIDIQMSMGVALTDADCTTATGLLNRADMAMYSAKEQGGSRVAEYAPPTDTNGDGSDAELRRDIRAAIDTDQLVLHYQPIVPLKANLARGFESFARWLHPEHGELPARRLLDVAELAGLGNEVGNELLRLAYDDVRPWFTTDDEAFVSFNVSANQVSDPEVAALFLGRLNDRGIDPRQLVVEVTEASFSQGLVVQGNIDALRHAGVRVFLDDFGVGYSSLSHLHHFPVDGIKIDSSVIRPNVDERLVRLIVSVAETLDIKTVAEGVETTEQLNTVTRLGVDYAQGYLLGHPARVPTLRSMDG